MRGTALALGCLALLVVAQEGEGEGNTVRLCGRDFVRAVVFTCGGSRWKRRWTDSPELLDNENPQPFPPSSDTDSTYTAQNVGTYSRESHGVKSEPQQDLEHTSKKPVLSKREAAELLTTSCCNVGCSRREISSLC